MTATVEAAPSVRPRITSTFRNLGLAFCFIALIASNVASFVSSAFNAFVGDLLAAAGFATAYHMLKGDNLKLKKSIATHKAALGRAKRIEYTYDFGDGWQHLITVEKVLAPSAHGYRAECIGGESACPPEDVGGPPGYAYFLEALADPAHEEHEDMRRWCGGAFDAAAFDMKRVNQRFGRLRL